MRLSLTELLVDVPEDQAEHARAFYAARPAGRGPGSLAELRDARAGRPVPRPADPPALAETVEAGGRRVRVRIATPAQGRPRGVHLEIPGGGFYLGSAAHADVRNRELADALQLVVVGVDHRLAPEHPWPAAPDDCETAARWVLEHGGGRFGTSRCTIGGTSAGATLAMTTLLRSRDRGTVGRFAGAVLQFGT